MNQELSARITSLSPPQATEIKEKPDFVDYVPPISGVSNYEQDMQEYELSQIPMDIENAKYLKKFKFALLTDEPKRSAFDAILKLNQSVQLVRTGDKCRITKI